MQATIGKINKRINSTKSSFSGTAHDVVMKDPQSRECPTFLVTGAPMQDANYMSFNGWYYWIDDVVSETNNMYRIKAHVDPLATWKSSIQATNAFINFGPKSLSDARVTDSRLTADVVLGTGMKDDSFSKLTGVKDGGGSVIMTVMSMGGSLPGVVTICGTIASFLESLALYCTGLSGEIEQLSLDFEKLICKIAGLSGAADYIMDARWVPYKLDDIKGNAFDGSIGPYPLAGSWYRVPLVETIHETKTLTATLHEKVATYPWLKNPEYMTLQLSTPGGVIDISNSAFAKNSQAEIAITCDLWGDASGNCLVTAIDNATHTLLASSGFCMAVPLKGYVQNVPSTFEAGFTGGVRLGTTAVAAVGIAGAAISATGTLIGEGALKAGSERVMNAGIAIDSFGSNLANSAKSMTSFNSLANGVAGMVAGKSINSGCASFGSPSNALAMYVNQTDTANLRLYVHQYAPQVIADDKYEAFCGRYGYPVLSYGSLGGGYYQCAGASVSADAPMHSLAAINSAVNSGIYVE